MREEEEGEEEEGEKEEEEAAVAAELRLPRRRPGGGDAKRLRELRFKPPPPPLPRPVGAHGRARRPPHGAGPPGPGPPNSVPLSPGSAPALLGPGGCGAAPGGGRHKSREEEGARRGRGKLRGGRGGWGAAAPEPRGANGDVTHTERGAARREAAAALPRRGRDGRRLLPSVPPSAEPCPGSPRRPSRGAPRSALSLPRSCFAVLPVRGEVPELESLT